MVATKPIYRDKVVEANGLELHYLEWGDPAGQPLVLLHGVTGHAHTWDTFSQVAMQRYRVLALDQRGHGDSQWAATYKTSDFVADLKAVVEALEIRPFTLIGLSMGAHNAMSYAAQYPADVVQAVLVDLAPSYAPPAGPNPYQERMNAANQAGFQSVDEILTLLREGNPIAPEHELRLRASFGSKRRANGKMSLKCDPAVREKWDREDLWSKIGNITVPTLILRGSESQVFKREDGLRMEQIISKGQLVEIQGAGHTINNDQPERFGQVVGDFLLGRPPR